MNNVGATLIATHMLLPAWWVRAFEESLIGEQRGTGAIDQALRAQLSPALQPLEMGALATVLGTMQEQILSGQSRSFKLEISRYIKEAGAGAGAKTKRYAYEKIAQILTAVKVLDPTPSGLVGRPIFSGDSWTLGGPSGQDVTFTLEPSSLGLELALGVCDGYADFLRRLRHEEEAHAILGIHGPLMMWKSLWLEMTGIEPLLYMRLERAMQWDFKWLQLDGTFGVPLSSLFQGLDPNFGRQLKILSRLGKRFEGHGFLAQIKSDQYLAFSQEDGHEPTIVWQIGRERLASEALGTYFTLAHKSLIAHHFGPLVSSGKIQSGLMGTLYERLIRVLLPRDATNDDLLDAHKTWEALYHAAYGETTGQDDPLAFQGITLDKGHTLSPLLLFFELVLRSMGQDHSSPLNPFAVPEILVHSPLGSLFSSQNPLPLGERLKAFVSLLSDSTDLMQIFGDHPLATLTSKVSLRDAKILSLLEEKARTHVGYEGLPKPLLILPREAEDADATKSSPQKSMVSSTPQSPDKDTKGPSSTPNGQASPGPIPTSSPSSRIMKIAADELQKIKKNHPEQYAELKKAYLDSLDDVGRKLIFDVQKRMQSHLFEEHLRQRILRFMVENPGAWRSAESSYAKNT